MLESSYSHMYALKPKKPMLIRVQMDKMSRARELPKEQSINHLAEAEYHRKIHPTRTQKLLHTPLLP